MPNRYVSPGLKLAAIRLFEAGEMEFDAILRVVGFSKATFYRAYDIWRECGHVCKPRSPHLGRPRLLVREDINYLLELIRARPTAFLDELADLLEHNRFISLHWTTVHAALVNAGVSRKKLRKIAKERNENVRSDFRLRMSAYHIDQLGWMDEVHKDERTTRRDYGLSVRNTRAQEKQAFERGSRITGTGLLTKDGMVAISTCYGSMTAESLAHWLDESVVRFLAAYKCLFSLILGHQLPLTTPFPGTLSVIVLDNAPIHHTQIIYDTFDRWGELIIPASGLPTAHVLIGVRTEYLPPYSPDLNPIEEAFSKIKAFVRRHGDIFLMNPASLFDFRIAMEVISPDDALGYISHAGYHIDV
jgi:transposase